jgi:hypothetical protein
LAAAGISPVKKQRNSAHGRNPDGSSDIHVIEKGNVLARDPSHEKAKRQNGKPFEQITHHRDLPREREMNEAQTEAPASLMPEMTADVSTSDHDKSLMAIWEKHNEPSVDAKRPAMPDVPPGEDIFKAAYDWNRLPLKDRQMTSAVHREFADLKKQGEALGMKTETAADMKAIQDMLGGKEKAAEAPAIDKDTQSTFDTVRSIFPNAKDHREAASSLKGLVDQVTQDPVNGALAVLKSLPLSPLQRHQVYEKLFGEAVGQFQPQPQQEAAPETAPYLDEWASQSGATKADMRAMAEIMSEPTWREIAGESDKSALDRAFKAVKRERARNGSDNPGRRLNDDMNRTLREIAADIARA